MSKNNCLKAKIILSVYLAATLVLLLFGYSIQKPQIAYQEFPFTITYSYQGKTETISDVYVGEYVYRAKYIEDAPTAWYGYIKDRNRLESDYYRIAEVDGQIFSINLNIAAGYLMGDPRYANSVCQPNAEYHSFDGTNEIVITDTAELEQLGFSVVSWEYPVPIENSFSYGGISMSSEATMYTTIIAIVALLACMILIRKEPGLAHTKTDKVSIVLNFLIIIFVLPFIFMVSALSEIVADTSIWQQLLYFAPALTVVGIAASVVARRCRYRKYSLITQFAGPIVFFCVFLMDSI